MARCGPVINIFSNRKTKRMLALCTAATSFLFKEKVGKIQLYADGDSCANPMLLMLNGGPCYPYTALGGEKFFEPLLASHTIVYHDSRGVGNSGGSTSSWQQHVTDAIDVGRFALGKCNKTTLSVFGYSAGTLLALNVSAQQPDMVDRVLLVALKVDHQRALEYRYDAVQRVFGVPGWITSNLPSVMQRGLYFSGPHRYTCYHNPGPFNCLMSGGAIGFNARVFSI